VLKLPTYEPTERHSGGTSLAAALREVWRDVQQLQAAATAGVAQRIVDRPQLALCASRHEAEAYTWPSSEAGCATCACPKRCASRYGQRALQHALGRYGVGAA
jgi:hypothetical protein